MQFLTNATGLREKEKYYQISLKIKYNFKEFSKMEKLVKVVTLKTICQIVLIYQILLDIQIFYKMKL